MKLNPQPSANLAQRLVGLKWLLLTHIHDKKEHEPPHLALTAFTFFFLLSFDQDVPRDGFLIFILLGIFWDCWIYGLLFVTAFGKLSAIIPLNRFFFFLPYFFLFFFWDFNYTNFILADSLLHNSHVFSLFSIFFSLCTLFNWIVSIALSLSFLFFSSTVFIPLSNQFKELF